MSGDHDGVDAVDRQLELLKGCKISGTKLDLPRHHIPDKIYSPLLRHRVVFGANGVTRGAVEGEESECPFDGKVVLCGEEGTDCEREEARFGGVEDGAEVSSDGG